VDVFLKHGVYRTHSRCTRLASELMKIC